MTFKIRTEIPEDDFIVEEIVRTVFGPGRFAKTAYRLRENPSYTILFGLVTENHLNKIVATVRVSKMVGYPHTAILGPIAVAPALRNMGLGMGLMKEAEQYCSFYHIDRIILVGDPEYYTKFGYTQNSALDIQLPGPVIRNRVLGKYLTKRIS